MKKRPLLLFLTLGLITFFTACNKDDDPAPPPVVGVWELDRLVESDYPAAYQQLNNQGYDYYITAGLGSKLDIKSDKKFNEIYKVQGFVFDFDGTWEFTNNTLNLNYTDPDRDDVSYTYEATTNRLLGEKIPQQDTLTNPTTRQREIVRYNIQFVYIKR